MRVGEKRHSKGRLYLWHIKNRGLAYNKFEDERNKVVLASGAGVTAVFAALVYLIRSGAKPSAKIGPGKSSRSHTEDEYNKVREIEEEIGNYISIFDGLKL